MIGIIEMGDSVILRDASGMTEHMMFDGCKGIANAVYVIDGEGTYITFMPNGMDRFFCMSADRFELYAKATKEYSYED
jgi:hypothetical protein